MIPLYNLFELNADIDTFGIDIGGADKKIVPTSEKIVPTNKKIVPTSEKIVPTNKKIVPGSKEWLAGKDVKKPGFFKRLMGSDKVNNISSGRNQGYTVGHDRGLGAGRTQGLKAGQRLGYSSGRLSGFVDGRGKGLVDGKKIGTDETMNRVKTDQKLRGQITRQHVGKQVGDAANKVSQFATKNAGTIGLVGAGAVGARLLNRQRNNRQ